MNISPYWIYCVSTLIPHSLTFLLTHFTGYHPFYYFQNTPSVNIHSRFNDSVSNLCKSFWSFNNCISFCTFFMDPVYFFISKLISLRKVSLFIWKFISFNRTHFLISKDTIPFSILPKIMSFTLIYTSLTVSSHI